MCHVDVTGVHLISIPAPPRGATFLLEVTKWTRIFQFTPLREGRLPGCAASPSRCYFNSRPSARGDVRPSATQTFLCNFNSRPSARGDRAGHPLQCGCAISIPAPSARGDRGGDAGSREVLPFQFPPLREGRQTLSDIALRTTQFQFPPLREGRRQKICNFCKSFVQPLQISMA